MPEVIVGGSSHGKNHPEKSTLLQEQDLSDCRLCFWQQSSLRAGIRAPSVPRVTLHGILAS